MKNRITITHHHLNLVRAINIRWSGELPFIDQKRPYSWSSQPDHDIYQIITGKPWDDEEGEMPPKVLSLIADHNRQMEYVLQILVSHPEGIRAGEVFEMNDTYKWVKLGRAV